MLGRPERRRREESRGQPLEPAGRAAMESAFGTDFGEVRVRTDPEVSRLGARAVTTGEEIRFAPGRFAPHTTAGRHLLAHELAHVVQQRHGTTDGVGPAGDVHEQAADRAAGAVASGGRADVGQAGPVPAVQLDRETGDPLPADAPVTGSPAPAPKLFPPPVKEPEPETDEERIARVVAGAGKAPEPSGPATDLREALRRLLKRCERDQRLAGEPTSVTRPAPVAPQSGPERAAELRRRIDTCIDTPEGQRFTALAKEAALSQEGLPFTIAVELAGLGLTGSPFIPPIPIGKYVELRLDADVRAPMVSGILVLKGDPSWVQTGAEGVLRAGRAVGRGVAAAAVTVGTGVAAGARWLAGGIASGARAVGRGLAADARWLAGGVAAGARAVGRGVSTAATAVGRGVAAAGSWLWDAVKAGAKAVAKGVAAGAKAVWNGVTWVAGQLWDKVVGVLERLGTWLGALPVRVGRLLLGLWEGVRAVRPWALDWWASLGSVGTWTGLLKWLGTRLVDLVEITGVGEAYETVMDFVKFNTRTLTEAERGTARKIFGGSISLDLVRLDERAVLGPAFSHRHYTSFHTISGWGRTTDDTLIHELTHVWQYEQAGAIYMPQALHAQLFGEGYAYGGAVELRARKAAGRRLRTFNREQQAQIVQDFSLLHQSDPDALVYADFVAEVSTLTPAQLVAGLRP